jgi:hypothetical protein
VDTDGTDGDRVPQFEAGSRTFQPFTSYRWAKRTATPNPCTPIWEKRISDNEAKIKDPRTPAWDVQRLKSDNSRLRMEIRDLQSHSFLIGSADPFIVLPGQMFSAKRNGFEPHIGDYCVVLVDDTFYPAIIGDAGPTTKIGEASLRICRQLNPKSNGEFRPVNDLKATYLIFPNSGDKNWGPPDLKTWYARCDSLLKEFDDYKGNLFQWADTTRPPALPPAVNGAAQSPPGTPKPAPIGAPETLPKPAPPAQAPR